MDPRRIKLIDQVNLIKDRKKQVYTFAVITFLVVIVLMVGAVKPSLETIIRLRSEISQKRDVLEKLENKMNTLNSLNAEFTEFEDTAEDLKLIFPANGDFSLFLANIESLAQDSGFDLVSISFERRRSGNVSDQLQALTPMRISVSVEGKRESLVPFMKKLESLPMYSEVQTLSFNNEFIESNQVEGSEDDDETEFMSFAISLVIFAVENEQFYE